MGVRDRQCETYLKSLGFPGVKVLRRVVCLTADNISLVRKLLTVQPCELDELSDRVFAANAFCRDTNMWRKVEMEMELRSRGLPDMMSASVGGGGSWKRGCISGPLLRTNPRSRVCHSDRWFKAFFPPFSLWCWRDCCKSFWHVACHAHGLEEALSHIRSTRLLSRTESYLRNFCIQPNYKILTIHLRILH